MSKRMWDKEEIIEIAEQHGGGGGGAVASVNGKTGAVVLSASDIKATNAQTIQANLERIDTEINRVESRFDNYVTLSELDEKGYMDEDSVEAKVESYHDDSKQDKLTAGANITIVDNVISATGGSGGVSKEYVDGEISRVEGEIPDVSKMVTTDTAQTITGTKTFGIVPEEPVAPTAILDRTQINNGSIYATYESFGAPGQFENKIQLNTSRYSAGLHISTSGSEVVSVDKGSADLTPTKLVLQNNAIRSQATSWVEYGQTGIANINGVLSFPTKSGTIATIDDITSAIGTAIGGTY